MKIYKLYAGMTGEFEILKTDAPEKIVIEYIQACITETLPNNDPNLFFAQKNYSVEFLACQFEDDIASIDQEIDVYDYF